MGFGDTSKKDKQAASNASSVAAAKSSTEDASWAETDKKNLKKAERAAEAAAKSDSKLEAKKERQELEAAEDEANSKLSGANKKASGSTKMTQAEIARRQALIASAKASAAKAPSKKVVEQPKLETNTNKDVDGVEATGVEAALAALGGGDEKKTKITFKEFEARELPGIKEDNPGLKMAQAKDKAFKMWERSPENPKNQQK